MSGSSTISLLDSRHNSLLSKGNVHRCPTCARVFPLRKTMLRHARSVHNTFKAFSCSHCEQTFNRKDTLERHVLERHVFTYRAPCTSCGRPVSNRAFRDHLDSLVCKASRAVAGNGRFDMLGHLLCNEDEDHFLLAMKSLRGWKNELNSQYDRELMYQPSAIVSDSPEILQRLGFEADAMMCFQQDLSRCADKNGSMKSYCTALVLGFLSFARFYTYGNVWNCLDNWAIHMRAARELRSYYHDTVCSCPSDIGCPTLRQKVGHDPARSLLMQTLESAGFARVRLNMLALPSRSVTKLFAADHTEGICSVLEDCFEKRDFNSEWPDLQKLGVLPKEFVIYEWFQSKDMRHPITELDLVHNQTRTTHASDDES